MAISAARFAEVGLFNVQTDPVFGFVSYKYISNACEAGTPGHGTLIQVTILGRQTDIIRLRSPNSPAGGHFQVTLTRVVDQLTKGHSL